MFCTCHVISHFLANDVYFSSWIKHFYFFFSLNEIPYTPLTMESMLIQPWWTWVIELEAYPSNLSLLMAIYGVFFWINCIIIMKNIFVYLTLMCNFHFFPILQKCKIIIYSIIVTIFSLLGWVHVVLTWLFTILAHTSRITNVVFDLLVLC